MLMALIACATEQTYSDLEVAGTVEAAIEEKLTRDIKSYADSHPSAYEYPIPGDSFKMGSPIKMGA
jgi:hypothetical protein